MAKNVRFGEYLQAVTVDTASVAYGKLLPKPQFDAQGREIPQKVTKLNMSGADNSCICGLVAKAAGESAST